MVLIAKLWMAHTVKTAIGLAQSQNLSYPREVNVFMDDSFGIFTQNSLNTA